MKLESLFALLAQVLTFGTGLLVLPVIEALYGKELLGLWIVFISLVSLLQVAEVAFQPVITRYMAYSLAGRSKVNPSETESTLKPVGNISDIWTVTVIIYGTIIAFASLAAFAIDQLYLSKFTWINLSTLDVSMYWLWFSLAHIMYLGTAFLNSVLYVTNNSVRANLAICLARSMFFFGIIVFYLLELGPKWFVLFYCGSVILVRCLQLTFAISVLKSHSVTISFREVKRNLILMAKPVYLTAIAQTGSIMVNRSGLLIFSLVYGATANTNLGLTFAAYAAIMNIVFSVVHLKVPIIAKSFVVNDIGLIFSNLREIYRNSYILFTILMFFGAVFIYAFNDRWMFSGSALLIYMFAGFVFALELNHSIACTVLSCKNDLVFSYPSLISGIVNVIVTVPLIYTLGEIGVILSIFLVQLAYNNWKWPTLMLAVLRKLEKDQHGKN